MVVHAFFLPQGYPHFALVISLAVQSLLHAHSSRRIMRSILGGVARKAANQGVYSRVLGVALSRGIGNLIEQVPKYAVKRASTWWSSLMFHIAGGLDRIMLLLVRRAPKASWLLLSAAQLLRVMRVMLVFEIVGAICSSHSMPPILGDQWSNNANAILMDFRQKNALFG